MRAQGPASRTAPKLAILNGHALPVHSASRGIGRAIALELASRGADVLVHYSSSPDAAEEVASELRSLGRQAWTVQSDLSSKECAKPIMAKVDELGRKIDALVLNAGMCVLGCIEDLDADNIDALYTYVTGTDEPRLGLLTTRSFIWLSSAYSVSRWT